MKPNPRDDEESHDILTFAKLPRQVAGQESLRGNELQPKRRDYDGNDDEAKLSQVRDGVGSCARELCFGGAGAAAAIEAKK